METAWAAQLVSPWNLEPHLELWQTLGPDPLQFGTTYMRGSTQKEALATQREKNIPHITLINNFFFFKG